jgi:general secretion pathway protein D
MHVDRGLKLRLQGQLGEALLEFQKAYAINPGAAIATQELRLTQEMIERERRRVEQTGKEAPPQERGITPVEEMKKQEMEKIERILPVPELRPLHTEPLDLKMSGQKTKVIFETIGKLAGINVLWDPDYTPPQKDSITVDFQKSTLEEALDYVSVITKSFWKSLSPNTIFVTNDNANKRRDYEEQVTKVFYLQNVMLPAELQEIVNVVRTAADINRVFPYNAQFALVVRGEADRVELAEKLIHDLDKPKNEVVVDIFVMEASTVFSRQITAALASTGLNVPLTFNPRSSIQVQGLSNSSSSSTSTTSTTSSATTSGTSTTGTGTTSSTTGTLVPAANLGHLSSADWATTLPSALLQAAMSNAKTKVLQAPQLRAVDMQKATMKIGEREPTASGSYQPGVSGVGVNALVNTQFTYIDVGVNVELTARVHDNNEVSMHISLDISNITGTVNLGGINEPIIGQRKIDHDLRLREGEVALLGGLINQQDDKTVTGIPGLSSIPLLRRLFSGESIDHNKDELMIIMVPHIVRRPEITPENIRAVAVGNATTISLHHAPRALPAAAAEPAPAPAATPSGTTSTLIPGISGKIPAEVVTMPAAPGPAAAPVSTIPATPAAAPPPATAPPLPPGLAPPPTGGTPAAAAAPAPPAAPQQTPAGAGRVRFNPPQVDAAANSNFAVAVVLEGATDVTAAPIQLTFDPKLLHLNDVTLGDFMGADGQQPVFSKNIQNDAGQATIQLNRQPGAPGVTSPSGTLVFLNFQAVGKGTTAVNMPGVAVRNSQGQIVAGGSPQVTVNIK